MKLSISETAFKDCTFNIDPSTLSFYGSTSDYDYQAHQSFNCIAFRLADGENLEETLKRVKSTFRYTNSKIEDYITVRTEFESYETDKRPLINIYERNGYRGIKNPLTFRLSNQ